MITSEINISSALQALESAASGLHDGTKMYGEIAGMLEAETETNFALEGRPDWVPLSEATKQARLKRNRGSTLLKILQDRGFLAASVTTDHGADFAMVGAGGAASEYAGVHQFGGTINVPGRSVKTRLRTNKAGELLRQGAEGNKKNLAVFAKDSHKQVRETMSEIGPFSIEMPARPYLPFSGSATDAKLQPSAEAKLIDIVATVLGGLFH